MATVRSRWTVWLGIALGALFAASLGFQAWQVGRFVQQGARFTAQDGQALCERVRVLEARSYGYRDAGQTPQPCRYGAP